MTPHNSGKGRSRFSGETGRQTPADRVLERIQTLTAELQAMQVELYEHVGGTPAVTGSRLIVDDRESVQVFEQFRSALDQIRNVLWLCTDGASAGDPQRQHQLARAHSLLRTLSTQSRSEAALRPQSRETASFFDRLDRVIDSYMQEGGGMTGPLPTKRKS